MSSSARGPVTYPARATARRTVITLALLGLFLSMDVSLTTLLLEPMKHELSLSDIQIGLLQGTAFGLAFGLSSIPMGALVDRLPRTRLLLLGLLLWIVAMVSTGLASTVVILMLGRIVLGLTAALLLPAALSLLADSYPPDQRAVASSLFVVGQACGQAIGVLAGGLGFDALTRVSGTALLGLSPWRVLYLAAAVVGVLLLVAVAFIAEPARQERSVATTRGAAVLRACWSYRIFLVPLLAAMLFTQITMQAASVWAPTVLIRGYGLSPGQFAGWLSAVMFGGGILGALAGGQFGKFARRRGGRSGVLFPGLLCAAAIAPLSLFAVANNVAVFATLLGLHILMSAVVATVVVIAITLNIPNEIRGLALGANVFASAVFGSATAPTAIAWLSQAMGGESMLGTAIAGVCIPSALLSAACFALAMRAEARTSAPDPV